MLEQFSVARIWQEGRRCVVGMRFAGERTECPYYTREPGSVMSDGARGGASAPSPE